MKRVAQDIKDGRFASVYLLCGDEAYLRGQCRDNLRRALVAEGDTMNCSVYVGKDINTAEIADVAGTMPFFAERRVIIIENSGWFKGRGEKNKHDGPSEQDGQNEQNKQMVELVKALPDTVCMIFVEGDVDKRGKLYKAVSSKGYVAQCGTQDEATLKKWVLGLLKKENKLITSDALDLLLDRTGTNMDIIKSEVEKLVCYKFYDEGITVLDVEAVCTVQLQDKIFEMVDAVAQRDQKRALALYYDLLALREAPMKILALIARQFNMLLRVKELKAKGCQESEIAAQTGLNPYVMKKNYIPQAAQFKPQQLESALRACVVADEDVKTGRMSDRLSVELIIVGLSTKKEESKNKKGA